MIQIQSAKKHYHVISITVPSTSTLFQIDSKLYSYRQIYYNDEEFVSNFYCFNSSSDIVELSPMLEIRNCFTMSGLASLLVSFGGDDL